MVRCGKSRPVVDSGGSGGWPWRFGERLIAITSQIHVHAFLPFEPNRRTPVARHACSRLLDTLSTEAISATTTEARAAARFSQVVRPSWLPVPTRRYDRRVGARITMRRVRAAFKLQCARAPIAACVATR